MGILAINAAGGQLVIKIEESDPAPEPGVFDATHHFTAGWATFNQVIPQGAVPEGSAIQVGGLATQFDPKTSWPDGSIRNAVITCKPTGTGDQTLSVAAAATGTLSPTVPTASVVLTIGGTEWTATLPGTVSDDLWLDGPHAKEWRSVLTPLDPSSAPHPFLRVYIDTRVYSDNSARVDIAVENNLDVAEGTKVTYDVVVAVDGETVFSQDAVVHYYLARWHKAFNVGLTESTIGLDWEPAYVAGALPRYLELPSNPTYSTEGDAFGILREGALNPAMGTTGGRPEIAPYPDWAVQALSDRTPSTRAYTLAGGDLAGSWPIHIRKPDGTLVSIDDQPEFWLDFLATGPFSNVPEADRPLGDLSYANASTLVPDLAHVPSVAYIPYLMTGDRYYADELAFWGNMPLVCSSPFSIESGARGGSTGIVGTEQIRARAWGLRNLADAAAYLPDSALRSYFASKVANNLEYYDQIAEATTLPLDMIIEFISPDAPPPPLISTQWMRNFLVWSLDHANSQGFTGGQSMIDNLLTFALRLFTSSPDYPREYAGSYHLAVGYVTDGDWVYYQTMAEIWAGNYMIDGVQQSPVAFDHFYGIDARLALLLCVKHGMPEAQEQIDWLEPQIPGSLATGFGWLIAPYV